MLHYLAMENSLGRFFQEAVQALGQGEADEGELEASLLFLRESLQETQLRFGEPALAEVESLRLAMLKSLDLYGRALDCLGNYLRQPNPDVLKRALQLAQVAGQWLDRVDQLSEGSQPS